MRSPLRNRPSPLSLDEARAKFEGALLLPTGPKKTVGDGAHCPCCERWCQIYRVRLDGAKVRRLIQIHRYFERPAHDEWLHGEEFARQRKLMAGGWQMLRHWGFLERKPGDKDDGNPCNGFYRITDVGREFALGLSSAPSFGYFYNNDLVEFGDDWITIDEALGKRFNYAALMNGTAT